MGPAEPSLLAARFAQLARDCGAQPAMRFRGDAHRDGQSLDYDFAKFWRRVERVTAHLQAHWGVHVGSRVAWLGLNHELQLVTLVACARLGAIFVPLNFRLAVPELQQVIDDAAPTLLVHDEAHTASAQALRGAGLQHTELQTLIATASPRGLALPQVHSDSPLLLVYTSGTTGRPKGALHTQAGLLANARASHWAHGFVPGDRVLSVLPLFHVGGL